MKCQGKDPMAQDSDNEEQDRVERSQRSRQSNNHVVQNLAQDIEL